MWILALDSSTEWCSVAVGDGRDWHVREEHAGQLHSERLLPMVRAALADAGIALGELAGIAFGAGPGSFTGIRIGCGVAQGLAFGAGLPLVAVPTLAALAHEARRAHGWTRVVTCVDARMREVYAAMYEAQGDDWRVLMAPVVTAPSGLVLPGAPDGVCGAGNAFAVYPALSGALALRDADASLRPGARAIGELALARFVAGEGVAAADALPLYVRHRVALTTAERDAGVRL